MKARVAHWAVEFLVASSLAIYLSTKADINWRVLTALAVILFASKIVESRRHSSAELKAIRQQLDLLASLLPLPGYDIRCTCFVPRRGWFGISLLQAFHYVPKGTGGGRRFSTQKGIIGLAYRNGGPRFENFRDGVEYRNKMISHYGYTAKEMGERTTDRRSYCCLPIVEGVTQRVLALLYFDSDTYGTFIEHTSDPIYQMIAIAAGSIRRTIEP